ncbi:MAG: copper chaperone PCu(A)C [Steroidobacteraceae bacterium]
MPRHVALTVLLATGLLGCAGALAATHPHSQAAPPAASPTALHLQVENAWIPLPPPGAQVAAAYFTLHNTGREPAVLVGVDCPLAAHAMLHESSVVNGESRMRMVDRLTVPPGRSVILKPRGLHVMLDDLSRALQVGQQVPLVLHFAAGTEVRAIARVRPLGSQ